MSEILKTPIASSVRVINKIEGIGSALSHIVCEEKYQRRHDLAVALINELYPTVDAVLYQEYNPSPEVITNGRNKGLRG